MLSVTSLAFAQKSSAVAIAGCYSDLSTKTGDVIGAGVVEIKKKNGKYVGTFAELRNEAGLTWDETSLGNLTVNELSKTITFDIKFHRHKDINTRYLETVQGATGKITKSGVKMNWRGKSAEMGGVNPFMKRKGEGC